MAMNDLRGNNRRHAKRVAKLLSDNKTINHSVAGGIWQWINGVADGISKFITGDVTSAFRAFLVSMQEMLKAFEEAVESISRGYRWIVFHVLYPFMDYVHAQLKQVRAEIRRDRRWLTALIYVTTQTVLVQAVRDVRHEAQERRRAVGDAETRVRKELRALHGTIEREAYSAYAIDQDERLSLIVRLLDYAVLRDPELKAIVGDLTSGILDLLSVDDPVARLLLGFLIKEVIDRLGVDKAVGTLADDLLAPILGKPKPRNIHDVIADVCARLDTIEKQWATFFADGGSQVEQAGTEWRNITNVAANLATVGFVAEAVADPQLWADGINDTVGRAANDIANAVAALFRGV